MEFRQKSILTQKQNLEHLHTFPNCPIFVGCTDQDISEDIRHDMSFSICRDTGIIQLDKLLPLDLIYLEQHNDGIGKVWEEHYDQFSGFLQQVNINRVLEIGAATGHLAQNYTRRHDIQWTIIEPNPVFVGSKNIKVIKQWFDKQFKFNEQIDTIVHTHVLEHIYDPIEFLHDIYNMLEKGQRHIFSIPNMLEQLKNKYTNCLNFEHTLFLTEEIVDYLLVITGFKVVDKQYFKDHSIFYSTVKDIPKGIPLPDKYDEYKQLFLDFIQYHQTLIYNLNSQLERILDATRCSVYLFGAHIFSQHLLNFGLDSTNILSILDNSPTKHNRRLYGTNLDVYSPSILEMDSDPAVILNVGAYRDEILTQLKTLNPNVVILE